MYSDVVLHCSFCGSGVNLDGNTVGIAFIRTMCSDTASVGLSQDGARSLESIGSTAAHELGHIFNMNHDDGRELEAL